MFKPDRIACIRASMLLCLPFPALSAFAQFAAGEVPYPAAMQAAHSAVGFTARNDREVLEVTDCGDSLIHVTARVTARPAGALASTAPQPHAVQPSEAQPWLPPRSES